MKAFYIIVLGLLSTLTLSAQKVDQIFKAKDASRLKASTIFELLDPRTDVEGHNPIASFKLTMEKGGKNNMVSTYNKFMEKATQMGGNCFSIEQVNFVRDRYIVRVNVYFLSRNNLKTNLRNYDRNFVAIIGSLNSKEENKSQTYFVNGQQIDVAPLSYSYLPLEDKNQLDVNLESIDGPNLSIVGRNGKLGSFLAKGKVFETTGIDLGTGFSTLNQETDPKKKKKEKKEKREMIDGLVQYDRPLGNFILIVLDNAQPNQATTEEPIHMASEETAPADTTPTAITPTQTKEAPAVLQPEPKPVDAKTRLREQLNKNKKIN